MKKKVIVLSLGGSIIIPESVNFKFLHQFKRVLEKNYKKYKFVIVCGGGAIARKYISALKEEHKNNMSLAEAGIRATRMNALFMIQFFGKEANDSLPKDMKEVKSNLNKNSVVFCGALRFSPNSTSDGTAAKLANYLKTDFINLTNVPGLYTDNPKTNKKAKLIPSISWKEFEKLALSLPFQAGQHFVLDQEAAILIRKHKIKTFILGDNLEHFKNLLNNKKFIGTAIYN